MTQNRIILLTVLSIICIAAVITYRSMVAALLSNTVTLPTVGTVKATDVGVYWDSGCSNIVTSVDWGVVEPGATKNVVIYIRNESTDPVTLSLATENWNPSGASSYMSLTWDYEGQVIAVDGVVQVTSSLAVSDTIEGITSFSFDLVITGSG